jgi:superfamily I DNA/RNA helicase
VAALPTEKAEAEFIVKSIEEEVGGISHFSVDSGRVMAGFTKRERSFSDFAVIYRTKEQARPLTEAFERSGIPFQSVGPEKLETRRGIREVISYLRLGHSVGSDFDLIRIVNFPPRGIGQGTVNVLNRWSELTGGSFADALNKAGAIPDLTPRAREKVAAFLEDLKRLRDGLRGRKVREQLEWIVFEFGIAAAMSADKGFAEFLKRLLALSSPFGAAATAFLANLSLEREDDLYDPAAERVVLMTMHASKGLAFAVLFVAGCEDGLIPFRRKDRAGDLSEEKRLFYVALTRAREKVFLTRAEQRLWLGRKIKPPLSPYVEAIQEDLKDHRSPFSKRHREKKKDSQLNLFQ